MIFFVSPEPQTDLFGNPIPADDLEYDYDPDSAIYSDIGKPSAQVNNDPDTTTSTTTTTATPGTTIIAAPRTTTRTTTKKPTSPTATSSVSTAPTTSSVTETVGDAGVELNVMTSIVRGRIEARLSWPISGSEGDWTIRWGRETCHVTDAEDRCQLARETYAATIVGTAGMAEVGWLSGDGRIEGIYTDIETTNDVKCR